MNSSYIDKVKSFISFPAKYSVFIPELHVENDMFKIVNQNAELYGCIPNRSDYCSMKNKLTKAALGTYQDLKIQPLNYKFGAMYIEEDVVPSTLESLSRRLTTGGLLVYKTNLYYVRLNASILSTYYTKINVFYLTDRYKVLVLAEKKKHHAEAKKETERLQNMYYGKEPIVEIPYSPEPIYVIPQTDSPKQFIGRADPDEIAEYISKSTLHHKVKEQTKISTLKNPIMPLHLSHLGLLLTTGFLDGELNGHIIKGSVTKNKTREIEMGKNGEEIIHEKEVLKVTIKILTNTGEIIEI